MATAKNTSGRIFRVLLTPGLTFYVFLVILVRGVCGHLEESQPSTTETFLKKNDSLLVSQEQLQNRLRTLAEVILQHQSSTGQLYSASEDRRMQARNFYSVILVGLVSAALLMGQEKRRKKTDEPATEEVRTRRGVGLVVMVVAVLMYGLDVHMLDVMQRQVPVYTRLSNTLQQLLEIAPNDAHWYTLDFTAYKETKSEPWTRISRKIGRFIQPNFEQIVFYVLPIMLLSAIRKRINI